MRTPREEAPAGGVYWMESSRRRQAVEWLGRPDLSPGERSLLQEFVRVYRTGTGIEAAERRRLLAGFDRLSRRLRGLEPPTLPPPDSDQLPAESRPGDRTSADRLADGRNSGDRRSADPPA